MEAMGKVDYVTCEVPLGYKCGKCGVSGVKLWRDYQTFLEHQRLLCSDCAVKDQEEDYVVGADGKHADYVTDGDGKRTHCGRSDQIAWLVPAVPTEEGDTFWGYTSAPQPGCDWWGRLPTRLVLNGKWFSCKNCSYERFVAEDEKPVCFGGCGMPMKRGKLSNDNHGRTQR